jgi:hypothetical protein
VDKWIKKRKGCVCTKNSYSDLEKKEILSFMTMWINPEDSMLNEIKQAQKYRYYMLHH